MQDGNSPHLRAGAQLCGVCPLLSLRPTSTGGVSIPIFPVRPLRPRASGAGLDRRCKAPAHFFPTPQPFFSSLCPGQAGPMTQLLNSLKPVMGLHGVLTLLLRILYIFQNVLVKLKKCIYGMHFMESEKKKVVFIGK